MNVLSLCNIVILTQALHPATYDERGGIEDGELQRIEAAKEQTLDLLSWIGKNFYFQTDGGVKLDFQADIVDQYLSTQVGALKQQKINADGDKLEPFCEGFTLEAFTNALEEACSEMAIDDTAATQSSGYAWQGPQFCVFSVDELFQGKYLRRASLISFL